LDRWLEVQRRQLWARYDLSFESPSLAPALLLKQGADVYSPHTYDAPPFVFLMYTPFYPFLISLLPTLPDNPFFWGRVIALCAYCGLAWLIATRGRTPFGRVCGLGIAVAFLTVWPCTSNGTFVKGDSLAIFLAASGLCLVESVPKTIPVLAAACFAVLAIATKQNMLAASAAAWLFLLLRDWRVCLRYTAAVALLLAVAASLATWRWGAGFWFCIGNCLNHPFSIAWGWDRLKFISIQPLISVIMLLAALALVRAFVKRGIGHALSESPFPAYFLLASLQFFLTIFKVGSDQNYVVEPVLSACLLLASYTREAKLFAPWSNYAIAAAGALLIAVDLDVRDAPESAICFANSSAREEAETYSETWQKVAQVYTAENESAPRRVLNLCDHRRTLVGAEVPAFNDQFLYGCNWKSGTLSRDSLIASLQEQHWDVVIVPNAVVPADEKIMDAVAGNYELLLKTRLSRNVPPLSGALQSTWPADDHGVSFFGRPPGHTRSPADVALGRQR
jgi:hypothetical protein